MSTRRGSSTQTSHSTPFDDTNVDFIADNVQTAIEETNDKITTAASPGFSFGRGGNTPSNTWLLRPGGPPSNKTGIPMAITDPMVTLVAVGNEIVSTFDVSIYEHEGDETNLTLLGTVSIISARTATFTVSWSATSGRQLAAIISSGSAKNPGVDLQLSGTA